LARRPLEELSPDELREEIEREERLLEEKSERLEEELKRLNELREDLFRASGRLGGLTAALDRLRAELAATSGRVGGLTGALRSIRSRYGRAISRLRWTRRDIGRYLSYLRWRPARREEWLRRLAEARARERELEAEISRLTEERRRRREELRSAREELARVRRAFNRLRAELRRARGEYERARTAFLRQRRAVQRTIKDIREEEARLELKYSLLPKLHRIKIRLYNRERRKPTPEGMFQTFWEIDALIDPVTEEPEGDWWLTREEIEIAKYHMIGYFKGMAKWHPPGQLSMAYFTEDEGIPYEDEAVSYKRKRTGEPYAKRVPDDFIRRAERMTVRELILGVSSKTPEPNPEPSRENMGVFFEDAMIIDEFGVVKWQERRLRWIWHPTEEQIERVKRELGIR